MIHEFKKITIVRVSKPAHKQVNDDLKWLGSSLGLFNLRDKNSSCFRIFIELLKATKYNHPMSSDEIAFRTGLSRGTVIFHIDKLISTGLVTVKEGKYILSVNDLEHLIKELKKNTDNVFDTMLGIAKDIDNELGL
ncbi:winged helix-turn-helix domain-containing protein [Candidatus Woesearchaeota archaeon]|nr:winged helix-turn-helix domain-containing protein [Candidatus Woesearchaeota archaeon]MBW3016934.1 winged helix-turn-helix domain-containing protein [Candidatus Woesearchaeota archaeon]